LLDEMIIDLISLAWDWVESGSKLWPN